MPSSRLERGEQAVPEEDEAHEGEPRMLVAVVTHRAHGHLRDVAGRPAVGAGPHGWNRNRPGADLARDGQAPAEARREEARVRLATVPVGTDRVDHPAAAEGTRTGGDRVCPTGEPVAAGSSPAAVGTLRAATDRRRRGSRRRRRRRRAGWSSRR